MTSPARAERLNKAMERRRVELDMSWREFASRANLSYEGLRGIRRGDRRPSTRAARRLEDVLQWKHGSIDAILAGGDPTPVDTPVNSEAAYDEPRQRPGESDVAYARRLIAMAMELLGDQDSA